MNINAMTNNLFTLQNIVEKTNNINTAKAITKKWILEKKAQRIRRNYYTKLDEHGFSKANIYEIASNITADAFLCLHTACEYYGAYNQVYTTVQYSSKTAEREFEYDFMLYKPYKIDYKDEDIVKVGNIKVTTKEKTIADCINYVDIYLEDEELCNILSMIGDVDENKLLKCLTDYNKYFNFQKAGFILTHYKNELNLSDAFFKVCKSRMGKSIRYLVSEAKLNGEYNKEWNLVIPRDFWYKNEGEVYDELI